ncbi:MAG: hypothetical protein Q7W05_02060 [Deltaproteobacteria bacterium]|nr:hypothetical protein [Deltaproteobacteria bacterium]
MDTLDRETAKKLFERHRKQRDDIRNKPEMASIYHNYYQVQPKFG